MIALYPYIVNTYSCKKIIENILKFGAKFSNRGINILFFILEYDKINKINIIGELRMKKMVLIVNPRSGKVKIRNALLDVIEIFNGAGYNTRVAITMHRGHASEIAADLDEKSTDMIVVSGGDGTLNEVVTGLLKSGKNIPIGYIPAGSTNDFASSFGLSTDIKKAAKDIVSGSANTIDVGSFNGERYFSYIASFGLFTSASYNTPQAVKNTFGHMAYIFEGIKDITKIVPYDVKIEADDKVYEGKYLFGCITNTTSVGGIVKLDRSLVQMNDGLFETVLVKMPANINELNKIIVGLTNSSFEDSVFEFIKCKKIKLSFDKKMDWSLDGEHQKSDTEVVIENIKRAVTIVK